MARHDASEVLRFAHEAMTTVFEVVVAGREREYARQAARAAFDEIDRIERLFTRFDPSSEVSRLNRLGPGEKTRIGLETYQCLTVAARIEAETAGAFDVNYRTKTPQAGAARPSRSPGFPLKSATLSPQMRKNGIRQGPLSPRLSDLLYLSGVSGGFEAVRLGPRGRGKSKSRTRDRRSAPVGLDLDLGAIGKGYAVDSALEVIKDWGIDNALIHAGTSTALGIGPGPASGPRSNGWRVGIATAWKCPRSPRTLRLRNQALSGSGTEVKGGHIIDPRIGLPARGHRAAWAAHPSATVSDALSTAFMVMSTAEVEAFAAGHPDVWGLVILGPKTCKIMNSGALEARRTRRRS